MAKTTIKGPFASAADAATIHHIPPARQRWLNRQIDEAMAETVVYFVPPARVKGLEKNVVSLSAKQTRVKRSARTARFSAKKK